MVDFNRARQALLARQPAPRPAVPDAGHYRVDQNGVRREDPPSSIEELILRQQRITAERSKRYFTRDPGINRVRFLPPWRGPGIQPWWIEVPTHQEVGIGQNRSYVTCQKFFEADCVICETIAELETSAVEEDLLYAKEMHVRYGFYANVARNEPDAIIKPWKLPGVIYNTMQGYGIDPEYQCQHGAADFHPWEFLHSQYGRDLKFTFHPQAAPIYMYTNIDLAPQPTPLVIRDWQAQCLGPCNLDKFWRPTPKRELQDMLRGERR